MKALVWHGKNDVRALERAPADQLVRDVVDDLGVPFDSPAAHGLRLPVRAVASEVLHRDEVRHELRQVFEIAPEAIELVVRLHDRDGDFDRRAALAREGDPGVVARVQVDAGRGVARTVAGRAAHDQRAARGGEDRSGLRSLRDAVRGEQRAAERRRDALAV